MMKTLQNLRRFQQAQIYKRSFGSQVNIERNKNFKVLGDSDLAFFEKILDKSSVVTDADQVETANSDWTKKFVG